MIPILCSCGLEGYEGPAEERASAIVGGQEAWLESAVALTTTQCDPAGDNPLICSALLISPTTVLTAGHCVKYTGRSSACPSGIDPSLWTTFSVAVGCHDILTGCPAASWKRLAGPPAIYPSDQHDMAVLRLAEPVSVKPTRLTSPARLAEIAAGSQVTLYGWGMTAETGPASPVLRSITQPIEQIPFDQPGFIPQPHAFTITPGQNPYSGTNHGDSGGPVLVLRDGEWFTLGVIQGGGFGGTSTMAGLVPWYYDWILSQASDFPAQSSLPSAQIMAVVR